jgi:hypothetical protein
MSIALSRDCYVLQSSLPPAYHKWVVDTLDREGLDEDASHEAVPATIMFDPVIMEAVTDMLGPDAKPTDCRHIHLNHASEDGDWHLDVYDEEPFPEGEQFAYMFYFPQDTTVDMGPTAALVDGQEILGGGTAGACLLVRHTTMHRATANTSGKRRYMLKYLFQA